MTKKEYISIGKMCRNANDGNLIIGCFAAELVGESYPFTKRMWDIVFTTYDDYDLGKKFVEMLPNDRHTRSITIPPQHQHPIRLGLHKLGLSKNLPASLSIHHDRRLVAKGRLHSSQIRHRISQSLGGIRWIQDIGSRPRSCLG